MNPKLIKKNIIMEVVKKNNKIIEDMNNVKNNSFIHFLIISIFFIGILLLIYKYFDKKKNINKKE